MAKNLYVIGTEPDCGKTVVTLGLMEALVGKSDNVGFFRPIINMPPRSEDRDGDIDLIHSYFELDIPYGKT